MHSIVDKVSAGDWSAIPIEKTVFLNPVHKQVSDHSKDGNDGLQRHKKAGKQEDIGDIDIVIS